MINFIKKQLAIRKLKRNLREYTRPDQSFLKSARLRFITMAQQDLRVKLVASRSFSFRYATIAIMAVLAMTSGMAVFADVNDVPVTHSLYQLKRLSENVRLEISPPDKKIVLHQIIVQRRIKELVELHDPEVAQATEPAEANEIVGTSTEISLKETVLPEASPAVLLKAYPSSLPKKEEVSKQKRIKKLDSDFEKQSEAALDEIQKLPINKEVRNNICKEISEAITDGTASSSRRFIEQVKTRCNKIILETDKD